MLKCLVVRILTTKIRLPTASTFEAVVLSVCFDNYPHTDMKYISDIKLMNQCYLAHIVIYRSDISFNMIHDTLTLLSG